MNLSDFCRRITGPDTRLLPENHKLGARLVCPEYSKSVQEVKTYPLLGQDRSFLLCWNFDSPGNLYATMMPSPENFCYHYSYSEGKYTQLHDAYLSVVEALKHGGISCRAKVELDWIDSEELTEKNLDQQLHNVDGILVPGGFGNRGTEGMILAAQYARVHKIPYLGICLGMQMAIVEFARHVLGYEDANSIELNPETKHPVIALMPDQEDIEDIGGTLRLGSYPCILAEGSRSYELFGKKEIHERHRHRYEVNNAFRKELQEKGMNIVGTSPDNHIVEMIEIAGHPFYVGTQAHPEFKSRPNHAHPLFRGFIQAAVDKKISEEQQQK